jgi:hypothetical protein
MSILEYISPLWLIIALGVGILLNYLSVAPPKIVIKYPTPDNADKLIFKDTADTCYKYKTKEVQCPKDTSKIEFTKIQHVENTENEKESIFTKIKKNFFNK